MAAIIPIPTAFGTAELKLELDVSDALDMIKESELRLADTRRRIFHRWARYVRSKTIEMFDNLAHGGTHRGVTWHYYSSEWYSREMDGEIVPAWGGVPTLYGKGLVKGKQRNSKRRLNADSRLLQDTGHMRREAGRHVEIDENLQTVEVSDGGLVPYAQYHNHDGPGGRPFFFFEDPQDFIEFRRILTEDYKITGKQADNTLVVSRTV